MMSIAISHRMACRFSRVQFACIEWAFVWQIGVRFGQYRPRRDVKYGQKALKVVFFPSIDSTRQCHCRQWHVCVWFVFTIIFPFFLSLISLQIYFIGWNKLNFWEGKLVHTYRQSPRPSCIQHRIQFKYIFSLHFFFLHVFISGEVNPIIVKMWQKKYLECKYSWVKDFLFLILFPQIAVPNREHEKMNHF